MTIDIPILGRSRNYGYIFWRKQDDALIRSLLGEEVMVTIVFQQYLLGTKRVDWKNRRISLGWSKTRKLPETVRSFRLTRLNDGKVDIQCH